MGGLWQDRRHRDEIVGLALVAHHLLFRDQHYLVRERKILMIDQTTGRVAPGRVWSRGLQQLLEAKEGCPPSGEMETIAQITYQRFFPRYLRLCGMSGTLTEAQAELRERVRPARAARAVAQALAAPQSGHARVRQRARTSGRRSSSARASCSRRGGRC